MGSRHTYSLCLLLWVGLLGGCADGIAPISIGASCVVGSECGDGVCYEGHCLPKRTCNGDGIIQSGEVCDDGNLTNEDACTNQCLPARCGDGFIRNDLASDHPEFEDCEASQEVLGQYCRSDCLIAQRPRQLVVGKTTTCVLAESDPDGSGPLGPQTSGFCFGAEPQGSTNGQVTRWGRSARRLQFEFRPAGLESVSPNALAGDDDDFLMARTDVGTLLYGRVSDSINPGNPQWLATTLLEFGGGTRQGQASESRVCYLVRSGRLTCSETSSRHDYCFASEDESASWEFGDVSLVGFASAESSVCGVTAAGRVWCRGDTQYWHSVPFVHDLADSEVCDVTTHQASAACRACMPAHRASGFDDVCVPCLTDSDCPGTDRCWLVNDATNFMGQRTKCLPAEEYDAVVNCAGDRSRVALGDLPPITQLVAGRQHYLGLSGDGEVFEWGLAQGGEPAAPEQPVTTRVALTEPVTRLGASQIMNCALGLSGRVWCWPSDRDGEIEALEGVPPIRELSAGNYSGYHLCGLAEEGQLYCWGRYQDGPLTIMQGYIPQEWPFTVEFTP